MSEERSSSSRLDKWMVMSLADGFHAYDETSGLKWPPEGSTAGVDVHHVWDDGWNTPPEERRSSWLDKFRAKPQMTEREYRRAHFVWNLSVGQAEAIGYLLPRQENDRAVLIPRETWIYGNLHWDTGTLSGAGFEFAHVRILMPEGSYLLKNGIYFLQPLPLLAPFEPSEAERLTKGIPISPDTTGSTAAQPSPSGRPSKQIAIQDAFHAIDKDLNWTQKMLCNAICEYVKAVTGQQSNEGLTQKTIMRHVDKLWSDFKGQNP